MNLCMIVAVPDHSAATLLPIIAWHSLPGIYILTDGWQTYHQLQGSHHHHLLLAALIYQGSPQQMFSNICTEDLAVFYAGCPS